MKQEGLSEFRINFKKTKSLFNFSKDKQAQLLLCKVKKVVLNFQVN